MKGRARTLAAIGLVLLVAMSGCTASTGDDGNATTSAATVPSTTSPSLSPTTASTIGPVHDLPLSNEKLVDAHAAALEAAGSFTYVERTHLSNPESGVELWTNTTTTVNVETEEFRWRQNYSTGKESAAYRPSTDAAGYYQSSFGDAQQYQRPPKQLNSSQYVQPNLTTFVRDAEFTYEGVETTNGTEVHVYAVPNESGFANEKILEFERENVSAASVRLYVTNDGVLKRFAVHVEARSAGKPLAVDMRSEYRQVGSTTVEPPSWLPEAKDELDDETTTADYRYEAAILADAV